MSINASMNKFNDEIVKRALELVDMDEIAQGLANHIQRETAKDIKRLLREELEISEWIFEELSNSKTAAGKIYQNSLKGMAKKMAESLLK